MKKIIGILLIGLLGFLGCSDSDDTTRTVEQATPVAPWAIIETSTPTYEWTPVQYATKYRLLVQDTTQTDTIQDTSETSIIDEWYTAEEVGCASEDGLCMVTPDIEVFEENSWKVLACQNENCGLWSETLTFDFTVINAPRFTDNGDGTVTDNNTKLIWTKNANLSDWMDWKMAMRYCDGLTLAGHSDWRLPAINELKSLIVKSQEDPALPTGNPFINVQSRYSGYWSSTEYEPWPVSAWCVYMHRGKVDIPTKDRDFYVWPVRSGS